MKKRRYYEKFFEDYKETVVLNSNGRGTHREYIYEGYYYRQGTSKRQQIFLRAAYALLFLLECFFLAKGGMSQLACNQSPAVVVCLAANVLCLIWLAWILVFYLVSPRYMTIYQYKSTALQLAKAQKISMLLLAALLMCSVLTVLIGRGESAAQGNGNVSVWMGISAAAGNYAAAFLVSIVWFLAEKSMKYKKLPNYCKGEE